VAAGPQGPARPRRLSAGDGRSARYEPGQPGSQCRAQSQSAFAGRDADIFGIGYGVARISDRAIALDADTAQFTGTDLPIRSAEHYIEISYQAQLTGWWHLQPDFQYFINPGGGLPNPNAPGQRIKNAAVLGLRSTIAF